MTIDELILYLKKYPDSTLVYINKYCHECNDYHMQILEENLIYYDPGNYHIKPELNLGY